MVFAANVYISPNNHLWTTNGLYDRTLTHAFCPQQAVSGISQISFGDEDTVSPKKPVTIPEVAKQRELSGTLESESEMKLKKQISDAKTKELVGHDIFAPPPEIQPRPSTARALALRESITIGEAAPTNVCTSINFFMFAQITAKSHILFALYRVTFTQYFSSIVEIVKICRI